jgi:hypothetical protein
MVGIHGVNLLAIDAFEMAITQIIGRLIVIETVILPATPVIAVAAVAPTIIDAAIEADGRAPIAGHEAITIVEIPPVTGRPVDPFPGRFDPGSRRPVIVLIRTVPGPVSRRPDVALGGGRGLVIGG